MSTTLRDLSPMSAQELYRELVRAGFGKSEGLVRAWYTGKSSPSVADLPILGAVLKCDTTRAQRRLLAIACGHTATEWIDGGEE